MSGCGHAHEDGAYVLGALSPADRTAFERHLPGCVSCQQSVRRLAGLPGLLARVPIEMVEDAGNQPPVPDTLLRSLLRRARRVRRRRTYVMVGVAAVALTAVAVGTAAVTTHDDGAPSASPTVATRTATPERLTPVGAQPISGWVSLTPVAWGTRLDLDCAYDTASPGYPDTSWTYRMVVTHADGSTEDVTSWTALPGTTIHLSAGTAATVGDIVDVTVRDGDGRTVLKLR
ncbi:MAG: zf-HC2 domain-containing protein [Aeromicrobium sp.]